MNATHANQSLPAGTRVMNTNDAEPGTILNGYAFDPALGWYEYEVETAYGTEIWRRGDFAVMADLEDNE
jgi:hypothetical protein